jgi:hypothetical protein
MKDTNVLSTAHLEGYLPPGGPQDVQRGIELARADPVSCRLGTATRRARTADATRPEFLQERSGVAHRIIWITFSQGQPGDPKYGQLSI